MTNKTKLAWLLLIPMWAAFINLIIYAVKNNKYTMEYKKKPIIIMTLVILITYGVLTLLSNYYIENIVKDDTYRFLILILIGWIVNIVHYIHYTIKYLNK